MVKKKLKPSHLNSFKDFNYFIKTVIQKMEIYLELKTSFDELVAKVFEENNFYINNFYASLLKIRQMDYDNLSYYSFNIKIFLGGKFDA